MSSSAETLHETRSRRSGRAPAVEIVIPVHNEERVLAASTWQLCTFMRAHLGVPFRVTIAENASSDLTLDLARGLAEQIDEVHVLHLDAKGRGLALRTAWLHSEADVVAYMDVDLSTDLAALPALLEPLLEARADVAIGTRLAPGSRVRRSLRRELISRSYNVLLRLSLSVGFSDAQCGFKAARRELIEPLLAEVRDDGWFFDTELLYRAQRHKLSIHEVPVVWVEDRDSRVAILHTALEDLRGIRRLRREARSAATPASRQAAAQASLPAGRASPRWRTRPRRVVHRAGGGERELPLT